MESLFELRCALNCPYARDWFVTVRSLLLLHDAEYIQILENNPTISFIGPQCTIDSCIDNKTTFGFTVCDSRLGTTSKCTVPIVFGSLFLNFWKKFPDRRLNLESWLEAKDALVSVVPCFLCDFKAFATGPPPLTVIVYGNLYKCPSFIVVDRRLPFAKKGLFHWYVHGRLYKEPHPIFDALQPLKHIFSDPNALQNKACYTIGRVLPKLCENYLIAPTKHGLFSERFYLKMNLDLASVLKTGALDVAISKTGRFCSSEPQSNDHHSDANPGYMQAAETSRIASLRGFHKTSTRWRDANLTSVLQQGNIGLCANKLISIVVKSHTHQVLGEDEIGIDSSESAADGPGSGKNISLCPGVTVSNRTNAIKTGSKLVDVMFEVFAHLRETEGIDPYFKGGQLVVSDNTTVNLKKGDTPRLDHAILAMTKHRGITVQFHFEAENGFIGSFTDSLLDAVTGLPSMTLRWIQTHRPLGISYFPVLRREGPLLSLVGQFIPFANHVHGPKLVLGSSGLRHETSVFIDHKIYRPFNQSYLVYPNRPVCHPRIVPPIAALQLFLVMKAYVDNIEDGVLFSKSAIERGVGMFRQRQMATFEIEAEAETVRHILYPDNVVPKLIRPLERIASVCGVDSCKTFSINFTISQVTQGSIDIFFTPPYEGDEPINYYVVSARMCALENRRYRLVVVLEFVQTMQQGDKLTTLTGQKGTVNKILADDEMPYLMDNNCQTIVPDIIVNVAAIKRLTISMFLEGVLQLYNVANPYYDMNPYGEAWIRNPNREAEIRGLISRSKPHREFNLYSGTDGRCLGKCDLFLCTYIKLQQTSKNSLFYTNPTTTNRRSIDVSQILKSRAKHGTGSFGVMETYNIIRFGSMGIFRQLQDQSEGPSNAKRMKVKQTFLKFQEICTQLGVDLRVE